MYLKSPYPDPPPAVDLNAHYAFFHRPEQAQWPDFTYQIDAATDKRQTFKQFVARVKAGATALGTPVADGGLGLMGSEEMVGIMSENSIVCSCAMILKDPFPRCIYFDRNIQPWFILYWLSQLPLR